MREFRERLFRVGVLARSGHFLDPEGSFVLDAPQVPVSGSDDAVVGLIDGIEMAEDGTAYASGLLPGHLVDSLRAGETFLSCFMDALSGQMRDGRFVVTGGRIRGAKLVSGGLNPWRQEEKEEE